MGKIKIEVAILLGAAPIWEVGEERDRKGVVIWGTLVVMDPLPSHGDYEDEADLRWYEEQIEEWVESIEDQEMTEIDLLCPGKVVGALWGNSGY